MKHLDKKCAIEKFDEAKEVKVVEESISQHILNIQEKSIEYACGIDDRLHKLKVGLFGDTLEVREEIGRNECLPLINQIEENSINLDYRLSEISKILSELEEKFYVQ